MKQCGKRQSRWLYAVILILIITVILMMAQIIRQSRRIQFSKNIYLSDEYLLSSYMIERDTASGMHSIEMPSLDVSDSYFFNDFLQPLDQEQEVYTAALIKEWDEQQYDLMVQLSGLLHISLDQLAMTPKAERIKMAKEKIIDVPYLTQGETLPNGCEAVSAVMLLRNMGVSVSPDEFVDRYLPKEEIQVKWGCRYGPNPAKFYAGDPRSEKNGFGCFAPVIVSAIRNVIDATNHFELKAVDISGMSMSEIRSKYINKGIPVAVWLTNDMKPLNGFYQWQSYDKSETYLYPISEHCMILTGYDEESCYFNDPLDSRGQVSYPHELVSERYNELGKQAVVLLPKSSI